VKLSIGAAKQDDFDCVVTDYDCDYMMDFTTNDELTTRIRQC
jgi:hypothetical protein